MKAIHNFITERLKISNNVLATFNLDEFEDAIFKLPDLEIHLKDIDPIYDDEEKLPDYVIDGKPYKIESIYGLNRYDGARYIYFSLIQVNRKFHNLSELIFSEKFFIRSLGEDVAAKIINYVYDEVN
jgi:hypothetical protein